jgi:hypothetical protein
MLTNGADAGLTDGRGLTARDMALGRFTSGAPVYENVAALLEAAGG